MFRRAWNSLPHFELVRRFGGGPPQGIIGVCVALLDKIPIRRSSLMLMPPIRAI